MDRIYQLGNSAALTNAAREFAKYAQLITDTTLPIKRSTKYAATVPGIYIGVSTSFGEGDWPNLKLSEWDDAYAIKQTDTQLHIAGTNERSVLFGVYAYFEHLGARWVRPGQRGEFLPHLSALPTDQMEILDHASYRHRGVCIEGSPSVEHVLDMLDWMAKKRMNSFFLQFHHSGTFWQRWYSHSGNPYMGKPIKKYERDYYAYDARVIAALKKRGMLLHQVGHGWTAETVDMPCNSWETTEETVTHQKQRWIAELNGKRDLYKKVPINTELCYSYKPALDALIRTITNYARQHPGVDVLHFWLSDAMNNKCECVACRSLSPADWYARLVNAVSEKMHKQNPQQRMVFLSYFESWWAPTKTKIESNRGNVILMFAPISRCFRHTLYDPACSEGKPPARPKLNKAQMPRSNGALLSLWSKWQPVFSGDTFLFDYYLWSGIHRQACDVKLAQIIHKDMRHLADLNLNGHISCQVIRSFWPSGLPMTAMAETLWNRKTRWSQLKRDYFSAAYGKDADWVNEYLNKLERLLLGKPDHVGGERFEAKQPKQLRLIESYLQDYHIELLMRAEAASLPIHQESLQLLTHHNQFLLLKCQSVMGKLDAENVKDWLLKSERQIHPFLDVPALISMQLHG
jgi:hypothetical protein